MQEKRRMRAERQKRKRKIKAAVRQETKLAFTGLKTDLENKQIELKASQNKMQMNKNMARTYWEKWRWEGQKRKELRREISMLILH